MSENGDNAVWRLERHDQIAVAHFSHPPRNFMTFADMTALEALVRTVAADDTVTMLILASDTPGYFVSHGDLDDLVKLGTGEPFDGDAMAWPRTLALFESMPQIVVAAIDGQAWGGGLEMTLACTMRVVGPHAHLALCEVGLGLIPGGGGTQRLPRLIGVGRAAELILTRRAVGPEEALRIGLAQAVLTDEPFLEAVLAWAAPIAASPAGSLRAAKRAIFDGIALPLEEGLALEGSLVGPLLADPATIAIQHDALARYAAAPADEIVTF